MMTHTRHARIDGPLVMIGFGSIGRGTLPLIQRHIDHDPATFTVIDPDGSHSGMLAAAGVRHLQIALTQENLAAVIFVKNIKPPKAKRAAMILIFRMCPLGNLKGWDKCPIYIKSH